MKHLFLIFILFFLVFEFKAATIKFEDERFSYETTSITKAKITKYKGSEKSVVFPTFVINADKEYEITEISGEPVIPSSNNTVEEIFIPSGISTIQLISKGLTSLKTVVIEDGTKLTTVQNAFSFGLYPYYNHNLDNIIVLSACTIDSKDFLSTNSGLLLKTGVIKVFYQGNEDGETIQMYLFSNLGVQTDRLFGATRFKYLLSALQKRGTDISKISKIDLSDVPNPEITNGVKVLFTFDKDSYNPSSEPSLSRDAVIRISNTESYVNGTKITTILDKVNFTAPETDITLNISYSRENTEEWNSVCLPFDIKESDFGGTSKIYTVTSATNSQLNLTRVETPETTVAAGTPCFIYSSENKWELNLSNVIISYNVAPKTLDVDGNWEVIGSFTNETIGTGKYKLNSNGTEFGITNSGNATVSAFRCYIAPTDTRTNAPAQLSVNIDEEASITLVPNDAEPQKVKLYDLMGRPRKEGTQGIFIKSTR